MSGITMADLLAFVEQHGGIVEDTPAKSSTRKSRKSSTRPAASAKASAARKSAPAKADYVPTKERRADLPTAKMLWALNAKGLLTLRKSAGQPLTFGACWDARAGIDA
jgi:hypothetical protein